MSWGASMGRVASAGLCALALACSLSPGGPPITYLSIGVIAEDGTEHPPLCTSFPVLVGSRIADRWEVASDFSVQVELNRASAEVSLIGRERTTLTYSRAQVDAGISGDPVLVSGRQRTYEVTVRSGCP